MSRYLNRDELAELVGCKPRSLACMKRWLARNGWVYAVNIAGLPLVAREYYEARMYGTLAKADVNIPEQEPNFAALDAIARPRKGTRL
ncbi:DUF4224 domain-containing protein [Paraburkholderia dipogonis]|uniref:DUF4224 domain-containing protein n=1 Tax=Paraburkholderia dipogonis TaxID=1211383 RepID=A0A4Y8MJK8_9BURK|nr:DUF4224 domain-containing protein [Paraburkholderia dipogonis]TFE37612.1 DUF4224 domain-containing protein [Paraburkholderia dipogonis]